MSLNLEPDQCGDSQANLRCLHCPHKGSPVEFDIKVNLLDMDNILHTSSFNSKCMLCTLVLIKRRVFSDGFAMAKCLS